MRIDQLLPSCYHLPHSPPPIQQRVGQFQEDTLFYLFYTQSKHIDTVSKELSRRGWRWSKELMLWVNPAGGKDASSACIMTFDPNRWERTRKELASLSTALRQDSLLSFD